MTDREAMKLALEALELLTGAWQTFDALDYGDNAIAALKERLADPMREVQRLGQEIEQEPPQRTEQEPTPEIKYKMIVIDDLHPQGIPVEQWVNPPQRTEQNFCSRCGKRTKDLITIHTCTPPQEKT
jgi:hypothetical protein